MQNVSKFKNSNAANKRTEPFGIGSSGSARTNIPKQRSNFLNSMGTWKTCRLEPMRRSYFPEQARGFGAEPGKLAYVPHLNRCEQVIFRSRPVGVGANSTGWPGQLAARAPAGPPRAGAQATRNFGPRQSLARSAILPSGILRSLTRPDPPRPGRRRAESRSGGRGLGGGGAAGGLLYSDDDGSAAAAAHTAAAAAASWRRRWWRRLGERQRQRKRLRPSGGRSCGRWSPPHSQRPTSAALGGRERRETASSSSSHHLPQVPPAPALHAPPPAGQPRAERCRPRRAQASRAAAPSASASPLLPHAAARSNRAAGRPFPRAPRSARAVCWCAVGLMAISILL